MDKEYGAWIEVDLSALEHNYRAIAASTGGVGLMPVVKANGYGLGAVAVARLYQALGAGLLAVTRVEEAVELREAGITTDILLLMPFTKDQAASVIEYKLTPSIARIAQLQELLEAGAGRKQPVSIHLKVETGLGRTGLNETDLSTALDLIAEAGAFTLQGIFSHLAVAHQKAYTDKQIQRFETHLEELRRRGLTVPHIHLANSTAILDRPDTHYNLVRPGTILYGQHPGCRNRLELKNPFQVKAKVLSTSVPEPGTSIGYGLDQVSQGGMRIAVLGLGWADGLSLTPERIRLNLKLVLKQCIKLFGRTRKSHLWVRIKDRRYFLVGRVAMQTAMAEVDETVSPGDIALVPMRRLSANPRLPRIYFYEGQEISPQEIEERVTAHE